MPKTAELTTSRIALFNAKNQLLTVKEAKRKDKKPCRNLPGGKREKDESLWECCRRECREETTIELPTEEPTVSFPQKGKALVYVLKLDDCPDLTAFKPTPEIADCHWREPVDGNYN